MAVLACSVNERSLPLGIRDLLYLLTAARRYYLPARIVTLVVLGLIVLIVLYGIVVMIVAIDICVGMIDTIFT